MVARRVFRLRRSDPSICDASYSDRNLEPKSGCKMSRREKAFIGQPSDRDGFPVACSQCDRVARVRVGDAHHPITEEHNVEPALMGEPRCSWHITGRLGGDGLRQARGAARARKRKE